MGTDISQPDELECLSSVVIESFQHAEVAEGLLYNVYNASAKREKWRKCHSKWFRSAST